ncbi:unnamed protein product [Prorocentrum cordatum]|uniref:Uncharacterized protein n=1 Tax=Prorocentrum cordatum TaxID=2364126 RepID=A0ABN9QGI4_9DINO|nr:unnamed protein product [Polarella glacialis]
MSGLFETLSEGGFERAVEVLAELLRTFDPGYPGSLHYVDKFVLEEAEDAQDVAPSATQSGEKKVGHREFSSGSDSLARYSSEHADRVVDRHPNGRPKLNLKARTKPHGQDARAT